MKYACTVAAILILLSIGLNLSAGEIIMWTDQDGNLNITNLSPPKGVKIENVIPYKEETEKEIKEYERIQDQQHRHRLKQQKIQEAQHAQIEAEKAKKEAEEAMSRVEEAVRKANEYKNKHYPRKKKKREAYIFRTRKLAQEVEKAKEQAEQSLKKTKQAEKEAAEAAKIVQELDGQYPF